MVILYTITKANQSDLEASFLELFLRITDVHVMTKPYDKGDDLDFEIVSYPHLSGDVPRATSSGVYISQLVRCSRACCHVSDFNVRNLIVTFKLLKQGLYLKRCRRSRHDH